MMSSDVTNRINQDYASNRDAKRKACDVCKRRKVRCTGENPCQNCLRNGILCEYSLSHGRLAHAERRVSRLQERLRLFENAWKLFLPNVELSVALEAVQSPEQIDTTQYTSKIEPVSSESAYGVSPKATTMSSQVGELVGSRQTSNVQPESEHEDADALTWDESIGIASVADGIGSLSVSSKGIGYMGPQSGNALLRNLRSISMLWFSSEDDFAPNQIPKPGITEDVLTSWSFANQCVDWYFKYYHCAYPILHEGHFRAQLLGAVAKPKDGSWPILYNTVLAIGAHSSEIGHQHADIYFYREASRHMSWDILQKGTLSLVQAFSLLANYLQKRDRPNSGFTLLGVAMNMAQGIGLHRELSGPTISAFAMEARRRVWWTLFIFDSGARVTFGRPTLALGGINTQLPRNIDDQDLTVDLDELPQSRDLPTVTSSLIWQTRLAKIGNLANEKLLETHLPDVSTMINLGEHVINWSKSLPPYLREDFNNPAFSRFDVPRMVLLWRSMHLRIVIHRPFILDQIKRRVNLDFSSDQTPSSRCIQAADECVISILGFWNRTSSHHGSLVWYACYWLVTAVFVHVTCILYEPQNELAFTWRQYILDSKAVLEDMGPLEPTAFRAAQILEKIMSLVPSSPDSTFFMTNEPIRMEVAELWNQSWADMTVPQEFSPPQFRNLGFMQASQRSVTDLD